MGWYDRKVRRVRDLSCGDTRIFLELEVRRIDCRGCGKVKRERLDFLADNPLLPGGDDQGGGGGVGAGLTHGQGAGHAIICKPSSSARARQDRR